MRTRTIAIIAGIAFLFAAAGLSIPLASAGLTPNLTIPCIDPHTIPGIDPHTIPGIDPH